MVRFILKFDYVSTILAFDYIYKTLGIEYIDEYGIKHDGGLSSTLSSGHHLLFFRSEKSAKILPFFYYIFVFCGKIAQGILCLFN